MNTLYTFLYTNPALFPLESQGRIARSMQFLRTRLDNGLTVIQVPMPGVKSVTALALVNTGRRYEPENLAGISHFLEHMVFKGTKNYETPQELAATIDRVGGEFNAFTGKEYTGYYVKLASRSLEVALDVVTDMLCAPLLRQADIDREKGVIVEEINMYEDMPMRSIHDIFEGLIFQGNTLGDTILGLKSTVTALTTNDFQSYMNQWYGFENVVFVVAGDSSVVGKPELAEHLNTLIQKGGSDRKSNDQKPHLSGTYGADRKRIVFKKTEQAHFIMGYPTFDRNDDRRAALSVLTNLFGKTMSSRLFTEIREKRGLCYYVRASNDHYNDVGVLTGSAGVDPTRVNEALKVMREEFLALIDGTKPVTQTEVDDAKENIIGQTWLDLEDSQSVASWYGMKQLLKGEVETEEEVIAKIKAVTLEEVQKLATEIIKPENLYMSLIGPFKEEQIEW